MTDRQGLTKEHDCTTCKGEGWLCEKHPDRPWPHDDCAGPGMPCTCNPKADVEWSRVIMTAKDGYAN